MSTDKVRNDTEKLKSLVNFCPIFPSSPVKESMPLLISDELYFLVQTVVRTGVEREPSGGQLPFSQ